MRKPEFVFTILSIIGLIMKFLLLPWASQFFTFTILGLCLIYMTSSYLYQDINTIKALFHKIRTTQKKIKYFGSWFTTILLGCLFKLSFWEHSNTLILTGFSIVIASLIVNYLHKPHLKMKMITHRAIIICGIGLIIYSTPQNAIIDIQHRNNPEYAKLLKKSLQESDNKEIQDKLFKIQEDIFK